MDMAVLLLMLVCAWTLFRALKKRAPLPELAWYLLVISFAVIYLRFDREMFLTRYLALMALVLLAVLIVTRLRRPGEGKPWAYGALLAAGLLAYTGVVSNYVQGWRGPVANIDTPLWNGMFYVVQGGDSRLVNHHRLSSPATAQRYALDLVKLSPGGASASSLSPGADLSHYAVYTEAVYAPCDGTVLLDQNTFEDLPAGMSDPANPAGNYVAIGCDEGFTVVLAHLQRGIFGKVGGRVRAGGYLGRVGNTGNTTEPHLHIHVVAGLVKDERQALFTGDGIPFTINHTVLFRNAILRVKGCPPVPGVDWPSDATLEEPSSGLWPHSPIATRREKGKLLDHVTLLPS